MKRTVLTFGLMSGAIAVGMRLVIVPFIGRVSFGSLTALGVTAFAISFVMVFVGILSYREHVGGGTITFGRAFKAGILTTLVSCVIFAISWELIQRNFLPDLLERHSSYEMEQARAAGATPEQLSAMVQENQQFIEMYKNPLIRFASSMMEAFPVGLLMTLLSAWILKKRR